MCPCLFIVENNQYGMGTSVERTTAMTDLAAKFDAYGIENEKVDGMDLEAVIECAERVAEQVRESGRPYAVEALTYRIAPHGALDEEKLDEIKSEAKERVDEAVKFADESDQPPLEELYTDVYAGADEYMGEEAPESSDGRAQAEETEEGDGEARAATDTEAPEEEAAEEEEE